MALLETSTEKLLALSASSLEFLGMIQAMKAQAAALAAWPDDLTGKGAASGC